MIFHRIGGLQCWATVQHNYITN